MWTLNGQTTKAKVTVTATFSRGLIDQLGSNQGLTPAEQQNVFRALSGVTQVAVSAHDGAVLMMVTGRAEGPVLPALEPSWKALPLSESTVLIGPSAAVDQASQRLTADDALGELASVAQQRPVTQAFWMSESVKLAGEGAVSAGVKRFELTASMQDRLTSDTAFEFDTAPEVIGAWLKDLGDAKIDGNCPCDDVHGRGSNSSRRRPNRRERTWPAARNDRYFRAIHSRARYGNHGPHQAGYLRLGRRSQRNQIAKTFIESPLSRRYSQPSSCPEESPRYARGQPGRWARSQEG